MTDTARRPRRWWIAALLNLLLPPIGYAYVGAWMAVASSVVIIVAGPVMLNEWTLKSPPGIYRYGLDGVMAASAIVAVLLALHAAWLARGTTGPAVTGGGAVLRGAALCAAPWVILFGANAYFSAFGVHPTYSVTANTMAPTLRPDDILIADRPRAECGKATPKPGDVVLFRRPNVAIPYLYRVVAGPGETVAMSEGLLMINGKPAGRRAVGSVAQADTAVRATEIEETLPDGARYRTLDLGANGALDRIAPTTVPAGSWYLMGDNRDNATDSRAYGPVPAADVCAVALKIVSSKDGTRVGARP